MSEIKSVLSSIGDRADDLRRSLAAFDGDRLHRWSASLSQYQQLSQQLQLLLEKGSDPVLEHFVPEPVGVGVEPARIPQLLSTRLVKEQEEQVEGDSRQADEAGRPQAEGSEEAVAAHNDRMAAAYLHLAERAQALELPGAATLLARGPPRARAAAAPPSAAAAAAAAAVSEPASSRALSVAPLFHNGDRVRVVSGGHPAAVVVHHLATGLRVPAKLVGDATRLGGGGGGASGGGASGGGDGGSGRAGEAEAVLQGVREVAGAEARLVLANGLHFPAGGGAVDWRLEGQVLIAGGARSLALTQPPTDVPQPPDKHAVATLEGDKGSWGVEWGATQPPRYVVGLKQGKASLWWPNEWSLVAQFENVRRADALRAALRPPPPEAEPVPPPPPKKSRQQ